MDDVIDFAVIGAGVAGTYAAWRLATAPVENLKRLLPGLDGRPTIRLFEEASRIGGRLHTEKVPGLPFHVEMGGMRYTPNQLLLNKLVNILELRPTIFDYPLRLMHLRGRRLRVKPATGSWCVTCGAPGGFPYELRTLDLGPLKFGGECVELVKHTIRSALLDIKIEETGANADDRRAILEELRKLRGPDSQFDKLILNARQWRILKEFGTIGAEPRAHLYELGFWNLLQSHLTNEEASFIHDGLGYESIVANWNVGEVIPWFLSDFGTRSYLTLEEGMAEVPERLAARFSVSGGSSISRNHHLRAILKDKGDQTLLKLEFDVLRQAAGVEHKQIKARHVILAIPKKALKRIETRDLWAEDKRRRFEGLLDSVAEHALFKLFLGYDRAWWGDAQALGFAKGQAVTDSPIRQVYYYEPGRDGSGVIMASYNDERYVEFWRPMLARPGGPWCEHRERLREDLGEPTVLDIFGVPKPLVDEAHDQLSRLHGEGVKIPYPSVALVRDWSAEPFGAGWHTWNVQKKSWKLVRELSKPFQDLNLYTCGEAYSCEQGWIEGALKSAELLMITMGIPRPNWVNAQDLAALKSDSLEEYVTT
jgi:hypothetical protein